MPRTEYTRKVKQQLLRPQDTLRIPVETLPCLRGLDPAARTVDELDAETLLERADLQAHGGLRDAEPLGRL